MADPNVHPDQAPVGDAFWVSRVAGGAEDLRRSDILGDYDLTDADVRELIKRRLTPLLGVGPSRLKGGGS
jgi:hypothetical protein